MTNSKHAGKFLSDERRNKHECRKRHGKGGDKDRTGSGQLKRETVKQKLNL